VALMDFMASEDAALHISHGPEGIGWAYTNDGTSLGGGVPTYETFKIPEDYDYVKDGGLSRSYADYRYTPDAMIQRSPADERASLKVADPAHSGEYWLQQWAELYNEYAPSTDTLVPNLAFEGEDAKIVTEGTLTIGGYVSQAQVQFIDGSLDIEKDWDAYLQKLESMGVQDYIAAYQRSYDAYMAAAGN
ncbi:MAG: hypothetical protein J6U67_09075, partial [Lachnospiraceae bacterium]|nr:hypothetical protein [Lachnospiraceae bacterium]